MGKVASHMKQFTTQVPKETYEAMIRLSNKLGRSFSREVEEAFLRHLETPPTVEARPLPPRTTADARPAGKPGRPPRKPGNGRAIGPQKAAERRTEALSALEDGTTRVSTKDERPTYAADEGSCSNLD